MAAKKAGAKNTSTAAGGLKLAVIGGDGTGPEVVTEGLKVLTAVAKKEGLAYSLTELNVSGERYLAAGGDPAKPSIPVISDEEIARLRTFDAIYLGAVGHPKVAPGILEKGLLLRLRFELDQYINLRPVRLYPGVPTPLVKIKIDPTCRDPLITIVPASAPSLGGAR